MGLIIGDYGWKKVILIINDLSYSYTDFDCYGEYNVDYPDTSFKVANVETKGDLARGMLI